MGEPFRRFWLPVVLSRELPKPRSTTKGDSFWIPLCLQSYLLSLPLGPAAIAGRPKTLGSIQYIGLVNWNTRYGISIALRLRIGFDE